MTGLAQASGIATPTREDLARLDRKRKKKTSNEDWKYPWDPDAKIAKMKDGRTHLAYKAEHAVDLETGALVAVTALAVLALGTILRKSAGAVTAGIVVFVLPYVIGSVASGGADEWLFRLTPAAGFSVLGAFPRSALVSYPYTFANGYYPLAPWAGLAVLCAYAALALGVGTYLLRQRDA